MHDIDLTKFKNGNYIYFLLISVPGYCPIKIGVAQDVRLRLMQYKTHSPLSLSVLGIKIETDKRTMAKDEKRIHEMFKNSRLGGEWFAGTPELIRFISRYCDSISPHLSMAEQMCKTIPVDAYRNELCFRR